MLSINVASPSTSLLLKFSDAEGGPLSHICSLYQNVQSFRDNIEVHSGHFFNDLEPNTEYYALVHAVFKNGRTGKPVKSGVVLTAPSKPGIHEHHCCIDNKINSSKNFLLKWKSDKGCNEHEVQIKHGDEIESKQIVKNKSFLTYSCQHEASQYTARIKSKNVLFGPWSDSVVIDLAPKKVTLLTAELKKETSNFLIRCKKATSGYLSYFCQAICNGQTEGKPLQVQPNETDMVVEFTVKPMKHGARYHFELWAEGNNGLRGQSTFSGNLISNIGIPLINEVKCHGQEITITWSPAQGATKHSLKVDGFGKQFTKQMEVKNPTFTFKVPGLQYFGRMCTLTIEAKGSADKTSKSLSKQVLIGGDKAVTAVVIEKCMECPRRQVLVTWNSPVCAPEGYSLQLCEHEDGKSKEACEEITLEKTKFAHTFVELKTSMEYYCKVYPIYEGNKAYGSMSNVVKTDERVNNALENEEDFGKPKEIVHTANATMTEISWKMVDTGENYKVSQYRVVMEVHSQSWLPTAITRPFTNKTRYDEKFPPKITKAEISNLQIGYRYDVKVTSSMIDLDTGKTNSHTKDYYFHTKPSKTEINDCECKDGVITFTWTKVIGAEKYCLMIKDELQTEKMVEDVSVTENKCIVQMTEKLCIGRTCMTKVIAYVNEMTSESDWKLHLLGGILVPRNVKASRNSDNPKRSVRVTFDAPKHGTADQYKIVARPENGKQKTFLRSTSPSLIEYLRKGIQYKFKVHAKQGKNFSEGSPSNYQKTDGGDENNSAMTFSNIAGPVNNQRSIISGCTTTLNIPQGDTFGKVRDIELALVQHKKKEKDNLTLSWKVPTFNNNAFDYKVEKYIVKIRKKNSGENFVQSLVDFKKGLDEYSSDPLELDLGEVYEVSVSTKYTDIDKDEEYTSSGENKTVHTRPCKPNGFKSKIVDDDKALKIEWNSVKGANKYGVKIYTEESDTKPFVEKNVGTETMWLQTFDDGFGYGTSYYTVITAIGEGDGENSFTTDSKTIGGDLSPKKVHATIKHDKIIDPNTQVYLSWESPVRQPESYEVSYDEKIISVSSRETEYMITGLKAGESYTFRVVAIHHIDLIKTKSGGRVSNKIQTNPTPTQVKDVRTSPLDNPSTSIMIHWNKVNAEKEDESTVYRLTVTALDKGTSREINNVKEESVCIFGLEPDTEYFTTVAGGNSIGFGKDSNKCEFKTALGMPKGVMLSINKKSPSTSLLLGFSDAEGEPLSHSCSLYQNNQPFRDNIQVDSGYIFNDLEPNTEYYALVHAVFKNGRTGKPIKSGVVLTAPSKPEIYESHCCIDNKINNSKDFLLKWKSDKGCNEHEIQIRHGDEIESVLIVKNKSNLRYSCLHESSQYIARIRTKNDLFGPWSAEKVLYLAPKKITLLATELVNDESNFLIQCEKGTSRYLSYFCQAFCEGQTEGEPLHVQPKETDKVINFTFKPIQHAGKYRFELWAEGHKGLRGQSTFSGNMISRPVLAKIEKVERSEQNPSTDIAISWQALYRCDGYEIKIKRSGQQKPESIVRTSDETTCTYRCQHPGSNYGVRVRGICSLVCGYWSEKNSVKLAPAEVELIEDRDEKEPVETIQVKWKELEPKPTCYHVVLYQGDDKVKEETVETDTSEENELMPKQVEFVFEDVVKPGFLYHCTVAAHSHGVSGKPTKTKDYRIKWNNPKLLSITHDENDPSRRAKISWEKPDGVNCFQLEIENNQLGTVIPLKLTKNECIFESGIPGNSYTVRLYCGCDGHYSPSYVQETMPMKPDPPINVKAVANSHVNGIIVTFKQSSTQPRTIEVCAKRLVKEGEIEETKINKTPTERAVLKNLVPGGSYELSVTALCNGLRSKTLTLDEYVLTFPSEVKNLRSAINDTREIVYKWDALEITPDEYTVQWRVNNEPIMEESTEETEFVIRFLKPAHSYNLRVMASNSAGKGKISKWNTFTTEPNPPSNIKAIPNSDVNGIIVTYKESSTQPKTYEVSAKRLTKDGENEDPKVVVTTDERAVLTNLVPGESYEVSVTALCDDKRSKTITLDGYVVTFPDEVKTLHFSKMDGGTIVFEWDPLDIAPDKYVVQWKVNSGEITEESTRNPKFEILFSKPAKAYSLRVMASNSAGCGVMTSYETFITDPLPPRKFQVISDENNPKSSFFVTYEDDIDPLKEYKVTAVTAGEREVEAASVTTRGLKAHVTGLGHGKSYHFKVQTTFCGKKSEELFF